MVVGSSLLVEGKCVIEMYDLYGRKVKEVQASSLSSSIKINTQNLKQGLYLVKVSDDKGDVAVGKVLVKK